MALALPQVQVDSDITWRGLPVTTPLRAHWGLLSLTQPLQSTVLPGDTVKVTLVGTGLAGLLRVLFPPLGSVTRACGVDNG